MFNKNQAGLSLGSLFGFMHLLWVIVIALGLAQTLADWSHNMHFLTNKHMVEGFGFGIAALGIVGAFIVGYVIAWVFAWLWNAFAKE